MSNSKKKLSQYFSQLSEQDQGSLLSYAEFLVSKENALVSSTPAISEPLQIPRPETESVIKGIKRLTATYPMLDKSVLLNEISTHMTQHIIHGKSAESVIDDLESEFLNQFKKWQG
ncbi:MAG: Crp/Fnr family transcriptional regulator [Gammaproteobacteria bacterium]